MLTHTAAHFKKYSEFVKYESDLKDLNKKTKTNKVIICLLKYFK